MSRMYVALSQFVGPHCNHNGEMVDTPRFTGTCVLSDNNEYMGFSMTITPPVIPPDSFDVPEQNYNY